MRHRKFFFNSLLENPVNLHNEILWYLKLFTLYLVLESRPEKGSSNLCSFKLQIQSIWKSNFNFYIRVFKNKFTWLVPLQLMPLHDHVFQYFFIKQNCWIWMYMRVCINFTFWYCQPITFLCYLIFWKEKYTKSSWLWVTPILTFLSIEFPLQYVLTFGLPLTLLN